MGVQVPPPASIPAADAIVTPQLLGAVAQLAKAPVSKTGDSRFESWLPRSISWYASSSRRGDRAIIWPMRAMVLERAWGAAAGSRAGRPRSRPGQVLIRSTRAASAAPTCTSSTASWPSRSCRWCPATRSSARWSAAGEGAERFAPGERVGVPWLGWACGECRYCLSGRENLCDRARFTGYDVDGGYAELAVADERFCLPIPDGYSDERAAPLLCAGLIGYRALRLVGDAERLGFYGFGACRPHPLPGRRPPGPARLRLHPRGRRGDAGLCPAAWRRVGRLLRRGAARAARRRDRLRCRSAR